MPTVHESNYFDSVKDTLTGDYFKGNQFSSDVIRTKYGLTENEKKYVAYMFKRVTDSIASMEATKELQEYWSNRWFYEIWNDWWKPAGSIMQGAGNNRKISLSNCTTIAIDDDSLEAISKTGYKMKKAAAYRQGLGVDISPLRPKGSVVNNSAEVSSGAVDWMVWLNEIGPHIGQKGRIPAFLFSIGIQHPDVQDFIHVKSNLHAIQNANISIQITDDFMQVYEKDGDWKLFFDVKDTGERIERTVKARDLMHKIAEEACAYGEPGVQFMDTCRRESVTDVLGFPIRSTNAPVVGSSLVATEHGIIPIKRLYEQGLPIKVLVTNPYSAIGPTLALATFKKYEKQKVFKVGLRGGPVLYSNAEHRWLTNGGMKRTDQLSKCVDYIISANRGLVDVLPKSIDSSSKDYEDGILCGWLSGDGYVLSEGKAFGFLWNKTDCKEGLYNIFQKRYKEITGEEHNWIRDRGKDLCETRTSHPSMIFFFFEHGYVKNKYVVPSKAFINFDFMLGFLRGLYESDGSYSVQSCAGVIALTSVSLQMLEKVQQLLLNWFGLQSTVNKRGKVRGMKYTTKTGVKISKAKGTFNLVINGENRVSCFSKQINFISDRKKNKLIQGLLDFDSKRTRKSMKLEMGLLVDTVVQLDREEDMFCAVVEPHHTLIIDGMVSSNCSEKVMYPDSTCVLASLNVGRFSSDSKTFKSQLSVIGPSMMRFLDDVVEYEIRMEKSPFPEQRYVMQQLREIGCGITNLHGWLFDQELAYDSDKGIKKSEEFIKYYSYICWKTSIELGKEKSDCQAFRWNFVKDAGFIKRMMEEFPDLEFKTLRNSQVMSFAPAGTLSLSFSSPTISTGIEPCPGFYYWKRSRVSGAWKWYFVVPNFVREYLDKKDVKLPFEGESIEDSSGQIGEKCIKLIEKHLPPELFRAAHQIDPMKKVELMSRFAKWVDSSMSVTYNIPENSTPELVESIYVQGWKKGVKSIAVYRDKSRMGVIEFEPPPIVEKRFEKTENNERPEDIQIHKAPKRLQFLPCNIFHVKVQTKKFIVIVGLLNDRPYEVFAGEQKEIEIPSNIKYGVIERAGSRRYNLYCSEKPVKEWKEDLELDGVLKIRNIIKQFDNEAYADTTRLVSTCLRHGVPISTIIDQLDKTESVITSFGKALMRVLKTYMTESVPAGVCPECGGPMVREGGCVRCLDCNLSKC